MANMMDYLDWRGDMTFDKVPFNEVDNLILAEMVYLDYSGIVPGNEETISLQDAAMKYYFTYGDKGNNLGAIVPQEINVLVKRLAQCDRYKDLELSFFESKLDPEISEQFAAITISLPTKQHVIAIRGTDDTIMGWKENFMMALSETVPAREDAARYVNTVAAKKKGELIVVGHSKGGNLAVYGAVKAKKEVKDRIISVYNNDGPGFFPEFLDSAEYKSIRDRIVTIVPKESMVGTFFTQEKNLNIVECDKISIFAHDGFTWQLTGPRFIRAKELTKGARAFDKSMDDTLMGLDLNERIQFVNDLFECLTLSGAETLSELTSINLKELSNMGKYMKEHPQVGAIAKEIFDGTIRESFK